MFKPIGGIMTTKFTAILKQLVAEQGKEALFDKAKCKGLLADYTHGNCEKESRLFMLAVEAGIPQALADADDTAVCQAKAVQKLHEDYYLDPQVAGDLVDTLAGLLVKPKCPKCGKEIDSEWKACPFCGAVLGEEAAVPTQAVTAEVKAPESATVPVEQAAAPVAQAAQTQAEAAASQKIVPGPTAKAVPAMKELVHANPVIGKKHTNRKVLIGVVAVVVVGILSFGIYKGWQIYRYNTYMQQGKALFTKSDYHGAIQEFNAAIKTDPSSSDAYSWRGVAYGSIGNTDAFLADQNTAISLNPSNAQAYSRRGACYADQGKNDKALADARKALSLDPNDKIILNNVGNIYTHFGKQDEAIQYYSQAIAIDGSYALSYVNRGVAYFNKGDYTKAIADCTQALKINPNDKNAQKMLMEARKALGR
jgi:Tfp pilus assembly protein PilF